MTSKEMEARSGVPRANIRYYEAEGLLTPERAKNGYRAYSQADLETLEKIKLLRRLGVSVEELRQLRQGTEDLSDVLDRRLAELGGEQASLERVRQVCGAVRSAGVGFDALDAGKYLRDLDAPALPEESGGTWWRQPEAPPLPAADTLPTVGNPVRRLVARSIDETLYLLVFLIPLALSSYGLDAGSEWFAFLLSKLLELLAEPLLLHLFGTTPGKVLMGLRLSRPGGGRLSVKQGAARLAGIYGCQILLAIPVVSWFVLYRCLKRCVEDEPQPWDRETAYRSVSEEYPWWLVLLGLGFAGLIAYMVRWTQATLPPNRGDLTVAEFAENVNQQKAYLDGYADGAMDTAGQWEGYRDAHRFWKQTEFSYQTEGDVVTAVTVRADGTLDMSYPLTLPQSALASAMALAWAQEDAPFWKSSRDRRLEELERMGVGDWTIQWEGLEITCDADMRWVTGSTTEALWGTVTLTLTVEE